MSLRKSSFASRGLQPKKIVLKNFKAPTSKGMRYEDSWQRLCEAINAIKNLKPISDSLEILYRLVEGLCRTKNSERLYQDLKTELLKYAKQETPKVTSKLSHPSLEFLECLDESWQHHWNTNAHIRGIFMDLDRGYALTETNAEPIWELSVHQYNQQVLENQKILDKCVSSLIELINLERKGDVVPTHLLRRTVEMLQIHDYYSNRFLPEFLQATKEFYIREARCSITTMTLNNYLQHISRRVDEETQRVTTYLIRDSTDAPLLLATRQELIVEHLSFLLGQGFETQLDQEDITNLQLLFKIISSVNRISDFKEAFCRYIEDRGVAIVVPPEKDKTMVEDLLTFKAKMDRIVQKSFDNLKLLQQAEKDSFERFINKRTNKPAEQLARYLDSKLRKGNKESSEAELDALADKVLALFRFINGKDVFQAFYKSFLSKRLLYQKSASADSERSIIFKLKEECGAQYTKGFEDMIKDVNVSEEISANFKKHLADRKVSTPIDMQVKVLTQSVWPVSTVTNVVMPVVMTEMQDQFKEYYISKQTSRKLTWLNSQGDCLVVGNFPKGVKDLQVSTFQAVILLLFNDKKIWSCEEIQQATQIPMDELKLNLQSMACGKVRVLAKNPKSRDVDEKDRFAMNEKFTNNHKRVKINQIQLKETKEENDTTKNKVFENRVYAVDAAVVRIMKTRKSLKHSMLINELYGMLKFPAKPSDLKKRIESLIDRDYLKRDDEDSQTYVYLA